MPAEFIDTNVLVYLIDGDEVRGEVATGIISGNPVISVQVLNELAAVVRRKKPAAWDRFKEFSATLRRTVVVEPLTEDTHALAVDLIEQHRFSFYDASIVAAALLAGCTTLWSEDMQDGLVINRQLTIRNPFRSAAA